MFCSMIVWIVRQYAQFHGRIFLSISMRHEKKAKTLDGLLYLAQLCFGIMSETTGNLRDMPRNQQY